MRWVQTALLVLAFLLIEALLGGTRQVFSLPTCGVLALAGLLSAFFSWRKTPAVRASCFMAMGLFVGWVLIRALASPVGYLARTEVGLALAALSVYLLTTLIVTQPGQRVTVVLSLMLVAVVQAVVGGLQQFGGERLALFGLLEAEDYGRRASGLYICPNHLAGFLELTALLGLGVACWSRRGVAIRTTALAGAMASFFGLALSGSRGGYVSAACGLVVFALGSLWVLWSAGGRRAWAGLTVGLVMTVTMLAGLSAVYSRQQGVQVRVSRLQSTEDDRFVLWKGAWEQAKLQPLTGTGSATHQYYARFFRPSHIEPDPIYAHNDYLQLLAEYGAIGLLAGLAFLGVHLWTGVQTLRGSRDRYAARERLPRSDTLALNLGALAAGVTIAVHSLVDFNLHVPANAMLVAFVFGLLAHPAPLAEFETRVANFRLGLGGRVALVGTAGWLAAVAVPTLPAEYHAERSRQALRSEDYPEAIARAQSGLAFDKKNPLLWLYVGQAHEAMAETADRPEAARPSFTAAVEAFQAGVALYPQEQWLLVGLGASLDALARFDEADAVFRQLVQWNPASAIMHFHLATHLRLAGRHDAAEAAYKRSLELRYTPGAIMGLEQLVKAREIHPAP